MQKVPQKGILGDHSIALGMDLQTENIHVVNITTHNPYKIHKGQGTTNIYYNETHQNIISVPDTGQIITKENPEYGTYLAILKDKNNLAPNQTLAELLNEKKINLIGFEDKHQQNMLKINVPGFERWHENAYTWKSKNASMPVPSDVLGIKKLQNAQALVRVEQSSDSQDYLVTICEETKKSADKSVANLAKTIFKNITSFSMPKHTVHHKVHNKALVLKMI